MKSSCGYNTTTTTAATATATASSTIAATTTTIMFRAFLAHQGADLNRASPCGTWSQAPEAPISAARMPSAQDVLRRDIDLLGQHCRIVLVGFSVLNDEHRRLKEAHDLKRWFWL